MIKRIIMMVLLVCFMVSGACSAAVRVNMLDIGQGDAFLIQTDNKNIMIDTGDYTSRYLLAAALERLQIRRIDMLILTHAHADHIGNAAYLINNFDVGEVLDNGQASGSRYYRLYRAACTVKQVPCRALTAGDSVALDDDVYFDVMNPPAYETNYSVNNLSVVGKLVYKDFTMLFTGDIESEAESELVFGEAKIDAVVLKAAHHGSKTSSVMNFVEAVNPEVVFISAGRDNKFGHPHVDSVAAYLVAGVSAEKIYCTGFNGQVVIESDGFAWQVIPDVKSVWAREYVVGKKAYIKRADRI